jgi:hypothetical protein
MMPRFGGFGRINPITAVRRDSQTEAASGGTRSPITMMVTCSHLPRRHQSVDHSGEASGRPVGGDVKLIKSHGLEGIVAKRTSRAYSNRRLTAPCHGAIEHSVRAYAPRRQQHQFRLILNVFPAPLAVGALATGPGAGQCRTWTRDEAPKLLTGRPRTRLGREGRDDCGGDDCKGEGKQEARQQQPQVHCCVSAPTHPLRFSAPP